MKRCCNNCESFTEGGYCFYQVEHILDPNEMRCLEFTEIKEPEEQNNCKKCGTWVLVDRGGFCAFCATALVNKIAGKLMDDFYVDIVVAKEKAKEIIKIVQSFDL